MRVYDDNSLDKSCDSLPPSRLEYVFGVKGYAVVKSKSKVQTDVAQTRNPRITDVFMCR